MASNPKYAELPGFAHDQPDLYETDDLPEAEQTLDVGDDSDAVEILHISTKEAHGRFKGCRLDGSKADFTDSIASKRKTGFHVIHGDWELNDDKESESLPQRYHRLKTEVTQFLQDVSSIESEKRPDNHEVLLADMETLEKCLAGISLEAVLGEGSNGDQNVDITKRLVAQLATLKRDADKPKDGKDSKKSKDSKDAKAAGTGLTYELYYKPEYSKLQQAQQVAALEERLRQLEATVGNDKAKVSMLSAHTAGKSLQDICDDLSSKLYLLDPANIERVESQLTGLHERLLAVSERKQALEEAQKTDKVGQMYEVARKVDHLLPGISNVLQSLANLQELHEHALQFSQCLTTLEGKQVMLDTQLKNDEDLVKKIQERLETDVKTIADNIGKLEVRMTAFK